MDDKKSKQIRDQWKAIKNSYPQAYEDLIEYFEMQKFINLKGATTLVDQVSGEKVPFNESGIYLQRYYTHDMNEAYVKDLAEN